MSPIVDKGLRAITNRTNLSTGLTHPNDMNAAKEMFIRLHEAGEVLLGAEISSWAEDHGWRSKDADELGALGQQIGMGKKVIVRGSWWKDDVIERLKAEVGGAI